MRAGPFCFCPARRLSPWSFQSSPAPKGGSHMRRPSSSGPRRSFNPLPPRRAGATPGGTRRARACCSFNPLPPRRAGATGVVFGVARSHRIVSILSRPEGREPHDHEAKTIASYQFQSSPAPKGGSHGNIYLGIRGVVEKFQSSPAPKGGSHLSRSSICTSAPRFQSSPAPKGGSHRRPRPAGRPSRCSGFNPLPPRRAGATPHYWHIVKSDCKVSILSRPEGREPRVNITVYPDSVRVFQSSPAPKGG